MLEHDPAARPTAKQLLLRVTGYDVSTTSGLSLFGDCCRNILTSEKEHATRLSMHDIEIKRLHSDTDRVRATLIAEQQNGVTNVRRLETEIQRLKTALEIDADRHRKRKKDMDSSKAQHEVDLRSMESRFVLLGRRHDEEKAAILRSKMEEMDAMTREFELKIALVKSNHERALALLSPGQLHRLAELEGPIQSGNAESSPSVTAKSARPLRPASSTWTASTERTGQFFFHFSLCALGLTSTGSYDLSRSIGVSPEPTLGMVNNSSDAYSSWPGYIYDESTDEVRRLASWEVWPHGYKQDGFQQDDSSLSTAATKAMSPLAISHTRADSKERQRATEIRYGSGASQQLKATTKQKGRLSSLFTRRKQM